MKIRTRTFLGILIIVAAGFYFLISWINDDLTPQYRESTEEPLVDASRVLASIAAFSSVNGEIDIELFRSAFADVQSRGFSARIYNFEKIDVDFRVYITDNRGIVIFDSDDKRDEGRDYSGWRDVRLTLQGEYGARTSRDIPGDPKASVLYVAAPIIASGQTIGVLTVGKPTRNANLLIEAAQRKIAVGGTITALLVIVVGLVISGMITRPIQKLTEYARAVRDGKRVTLPALGRSEMRELGIAFEEMRDALEGKKYVENYLQTLTHEIKSPLSAIQGAIELIDDDMPEEKKQQFLENIRVEADRIRDIVDKLLLLSSLESRKAEIDREEIDLADLLNDVVSSLLPLIESKQLKLELKAEDDPIIKGERFLVRHAAANLLQNAIDFSALGQTIHITLQNSPDYVSLIIRDHGPGIPSYATEKIFDRFYSLKRPDSGKKSSGLGLSLVKEVALLHGGSASLNNLSEGGAEATLRFPRAATSQK